MYKLTKKDHMISDESNKYTISNFVITFACFIKVFEKQNVDLTIFRKVWAPFDFTILSIGAELTKSGKSALTVLSTP